MDLTAAIRTKIDQLRNAKTARYNSLSTSLESEVVILTQRNADLFTKLEDALEAKALGKTEDIEKFKPEDDMTERGEEEEDEKVDHRPIKPKHPDSGAEVDDPEDDMKENLYYDEGHPQGYPYCIPIVGEGPYAPISPPSLTESNPSRPPPPKKQDESTMSVCAPTTDPTPGSKIAGEIPSESPVAYLRSRAQETQTTLAEKHAFLTQLRRKHDVAMKRLDKLQSDLEKVSQRWEAEERQRIQLESTTAVGKKRKREDAAKEEGGAQKKWKRFGLKSAEWGVLFGFGVVSAMGVSKFSQAVNLV